MSKPPRPPNQGGRGMVLLTLLIALLIAGIALQGALDVWALQRQRWQEEELLYVGDQYRKAIQHYYLTSRTLPTSVDDLLEDKRFPVPIHHLRRAYPDPITGKNDWQFLRDGERIYGVYSNSTAETIKRANFPRRYAYFAEAKTYGDWRFMYQPPGRQGRSATDAPGAPVRYGPGGKPAPAAPFVGAGQRR